MPSTNMQKVLNPMTNVYQTQLEASRQFADAIFSGAEKIDHVLLEASHRACIEQLKFAQSLVAVRDAQGAVNAQAMFFSQRPDRAMDYQRELIRVITEVQSELGKSMRNYLEQLRSGTASGVSALEKDTEAEREIYNPLAYNPLAGMMSAWQSAFREATTVASRNMEAARSTFANVVDTANASAEEALDETDETVEAMTAGRERKAAHFR